MGLFDQILGEVTSALGGQSAHGPLAESVLHLLNDPQTGGLQGLVSKLESGGLGEIVGSWVGTGANLPVSADQLRQALGGDTLARLAQSAGIAPESIGPKLAEVLPVLVDKLTPNGSVGVQGLLQKGLGSLMGGR